MRGRPVVDIDQKTKDRILELKNDGYKLYEIASMLNISKFYIKKILDEAILIFPEPRWDANVPAPSTD